MLPSKIYKTFTVKQDCIDLNEALHETLSAAHTNKEINNYLPSKGFGVIIKHATLDKWALKVEFGKVGSWDVYLALHTDSESLESLGLDWFPDMNVKHEF